MVGEFVLAHLPDSVSERKKVLAAIIHVLPDGKLRAGASLSLELLDRHERQQLKISNIT